MIDVSTMGLYGCNQTSWDCCHFLLGGFTNYCPDFCQATLDMNNISLHKSLKNIGVYRLKTTRTICFFCNDQLINFILTYFY